MRRSRTPAELGLGHHDRWRPERALGRASRARHFRRIQAVLLVARGWPVGQVAAVTGLRRWAVYHCVRRYLRARRPEDLDDAPRPGRPAAAPRVTDARILREWRKDPLGLGYSATGWTVPLFARHLSRTFGCPITPPTLRRRLRRLGLRWKRPRYRYAGRDPHRAQKKGGSFAA